MHSCGWLLQRAADGRRGDRRINHPPAGTLPNVDIVDAFAARAKSADDVGTVAGGGAGGEPHCYPNPELVPRVFLSDEQMARVPYHWCGDFQYKLLATGDVVRLHPDCPLPLLGMVTTRAVADGEELWLNYRLDGAAKPEWYTSVRG